MAYDFLRVLRTPHSERYLLREAGREFAALDLHFLPDKQVAGTLVLFDHAPTDEGFVASLLTEIDETLLPEASIEGGDISFTVVAGRVLATFRPSET